MERAAHMGGTVGGVVTCKGIITRNKVEVMDGVTYNVGNWQNTQRQNKANLTTEQLDKLEDAGFVWVVAKHTWEDSLAAWSRAADKGPVTYRQVEVMDSEAYNVGDWQNNQRRNRNNLSDEQKDKLEKARFNWSARHT
jgi:uncharacterized protein YutD